ncbi:MAG: cyclopropane fatty-acyl-phospholipid synthase-like methyltransferase, partial [Myxococcota bacterium]
MARQWWQDEHFWRDLAPYLFPERSFAQADSELDDILDELDVAEGARILDAGCGPGRYLIPLVERGYQVVGYDICSEYRRWARARGAERNLELDIRP